MKPVKGSFPHHCSCKATSRPGKQHTDGVISAGWSLAAWTTSPTGTKHAHHTQGKETRGPLIAPPLVPPVPQLASLQLSPPHCSPQKPWGQQSEAPHLLPHLKHPLSCFIIKPTRQSLSMSPRNLCKEKEKGKNYTERWFYRPWGHLTLS